MWEYGLHFDNTRTLCQCVISNRSQNTLYRQTLVLFGLGKISHNQILMCCYFHMKEPQNSKIICVAFLWFCLFVQDCSSFYLLLSVWGYVCATNMKLIWTWPFIKCTSNMVWWSWVKWCFPWWLVSLSTSISFTLGELSSGCLWCPYYIIKSTYY